jgi:enoyl-CoA hydratase
MVQKKLAKILVFMACITMPIFAIQSFAFSSEPLATINTFKNISLSSHQSVLLIKIVNPPRNAVSKLTLLEINKVLDLAEHNSAVGVIVITGSDGVFSEGAGAGNMTQQLTGEDTHGYWARRVFNRIERFPKVVIAAISGKSSGGGNELAMACDIRIASDKALFSQPELEVGLIPGFGGMQRLPRLIGLGRAMEMMLTGRIIGAKEALSIGLITAIFPDKQLEQESIKLANALSKRLNKPALAHFKKRMVTSYDETFSDALEHDQLTFDRIFYSPEGQKALKKYIEKQKKNKHSIID